MPEKQGTSWFAAIAPGILVAATGVGAGDLITASIAGSTLGVTVLWAAAAGALLKWTLNEGLARWQMATGTTLLEGWVHRLGSWIQWVFLAYFLIWSFAVGGAMVSACGVAGTGLLPLGDPDTSRILWGILHSIVGLALIRAGGFALFEKLMAVCIGAMFLGVLLTAVLIRPDWGAVLRGLAIPIIPRGGTGWVLALMGGVGGTVTLLSYGYWIRERGRTGLDGVRACRLDLAIGYGATALFGMAMVIIGSRISPSGKGARVALQLAEQLGEALGPVGKWLFLIGFWGAVFSSLLGVWQSAPYLFADFLALRRGLPDEEYRQLDLAQTPAYRLFQIALAFIPLVLLWTTVRQVQFVYAVLGAAFMPLVALTLLIMNNREEWVGKPFRSGWLVNLLLVVTLLFFVWTGLTGRGD
jgi:Mn2+/Fe2+ NRAMP family transporter